MYLYDSLIIFGALVNLALPVVLIVYIRKSARSEKEFQEFTGEWLKRVQAQNERLRQNIDRQKQYLAQKYNT